MLPCPSSVTLACWWGGRSRYCPSSSGPSQLEFERTSSAVTAYAIHQAALKPGLGGSLDDRFDLRDGAVVSGSIDGGGSGLPAGESNVDYLRCKSCHAVVCLARSP